MIDWSYIKSDKSSPASAEVGTLCLWVSQMRDCPDGRWVWTGDLPNNQGDGIRTPPPIFGIANSRAEAMKNAKKAVRRWLISRPTAVN